MTLKRKNVPRLSSGELRRLRAAKDWRALWEQALPLVGFAIKKLVARGSLRAEYATDDITQDVNLAARKFVESWDPNRGKFSTWIIRNCTGEALKSIARAANGSIGGRDARGITLGFYEEHSVLPALSEAFQDPAAIAESEEILLALRMGEAVLPARHARLLAEVRSGASLSKAAACIRVSPRTADTVYAEAKEKLRQFLLLRYSKPVNGEQI